jgi:hypothetical protein
VSTDVELDAKLARIGRRVQAQKSRDRETVERHPDAKAALAELRATFWKAGERRPWYLRDADGIVGDADHEAALAKGICPVAYNPPKVRR